MSRLIYAANLHYGGGVQVATSVISEFATIINRDDEIAVWVSSEVDENLKQLGFNAANFIQYRIINHHGLSTIFSLERKEMEDFDKIFALFGPLYVRTHKPFRIVGFAQAWIIYPGNDAYKKLKPIKRIFHKLKFRLQAYFFRYAELLVVEHEHVRAGLVRIGLMADKKICTVPNCISGIYNKPELWRRVALPERKKNILRLGYVGKNYPHKNTAIFPAIIKILRDHYSLEVEFYVTFSSEEWNDCSETFQQEINNVGPLAVAECPSFYQQLDGVVFPSLLECFSATPLEAMVMELPIFASERCFVKDICLDFGCYFDPLNPDDAAEVIAGYFKNPKTNAQLSFARDYALQYSDPKTRAKNYLNLLINTD